jgi:DNA-binding NtrC family response regulator
VPPGNATLGRVFVVDDDEPMRRVLSRTLQRAEFGPVTFDSPQKLLAALENDPDVDLVISDVRMPEMSGLELLSAVKDNWPHIPVVFLTGQADIATAVEAMRRGGYDYLTKPFDPSATLIPTVRRAVSHRRLASQNLLLQRQLELTARHPSIVGESRLIREVFSLISSAAPTDATVLITGESGTGKELVARSIHDQSHRSNAPFVDVNCGALSETVLESELFGHTKGAFTGAINARRGVFEEASGGTLFLDEIGELSAATQVKLLRALQEGVIRPVGASQSQEVDVRVVAATNRDLVLEVEEGRFRQDLFYRLDVLTIHVPPLRQRKEDIPVLVHHFLRKHSARLGTPVTSVAPETLERLVAHRWPGNVRELENAVERALVLAKSDCFTVDLLPEQWRKSPLLREPGADPRLLLSLADAKGAFEREYLERVLDRAEGKLGDAARLAGVDPSNLRRLLKRHGMTAR